jgi:hypothetical protein
MAENLLSKFNLDGTEMMIADTKARADASNATSIATTANTNASKAISTANSAKATALKKALITYDSGTYTMTITQGGE